MRVASIDEFGRYVTKVYVSEFFTLQCMAHQTPDDGLTWNCIGILTSNHFRQPVVHEFKVPDYGEDHLVNECNLVLSNWLYHLGTELKNFSYDFWAGKDND